MYTHQGEGTLRLVRPVGWFYLLDNPQGGATGKLFGGQAAVGVAAGPATIEVAPGFYAYDDIDTLAAESAGNRRTTDAMGAFTGFVEPFRLLDTVATVGFQAGSLPVAVTGEVFVNVGADDENLGFYAGFQVGNLKAPRDWMFKYFYSDLQADSALGAVVQDDFRLGTNYRGHEGHFGVQLASRLKLFARAYLFQFRPGDDEATPVDEGRLQLRARLDMDVSF
jgi:hypothetical protein